MHTPAAATDFAALDAAAGALSVAPRNGEIHTFAGSPMGVPGDPRLDFPDGEGTIEFWFKRNWTKSLKGGNYAAVIANARTVVDDSGGEPEQRYRARWAVYLNDSEVAVHVGDRLETRGLFGAGAKGNVTGAGGLTHVALVFAREQVTVVVGGNVLGVIQDMPLGDVAGTTLSLASVGAAAGKLPGGRKPAQEAVRDLEGQLARVRVWSTAIDPQYFAASASRVGVMMGIGDDHLRQGLAVPGLRGIDRPRLSQLVVRSDFDGPAHAHQMIRAGALAGSWLADSFEKAVPLPAGLGTPTGMGSLARPPVLSIVPGVREGILLTYLDGVHAGVLRSTGTGGSWRFEPHAAGPGLPSAKVSFRGNDGDELVFDFTSTTDRFSAPGNSGRQSIAFRRPDPSGWRGPRIDPTNIYVENNLASHTKVARRAYNVVKMDPIRFFDDRTGSDRTVFAEPLSHEWFWELEGQKVGAPGWYRVMSLNESTVSSSSVSTATTADFRDAMGARLGASIGVPGTAAVDFDLSANYGRFGSRSTVHSRSVGMGFVRLFALALEPTTVPLDDAFRSAVMALRDAERSESRCGDGLLEFEEQCDDGNDDPDDGCADCEVVDEDRFRAALAARYEASKEGESATTRPSSAYRQFIEDWGTHYSYSTTFGATLISVATVTESEVKAGSKYGFDVGFESRSGQEKMGPRGGFSMEMEESRSTMDKKEEKWLMSIPEGSLSPDTTFVSTQVDKGTAAPIFLDLRPLHELLSPVHFDDPVVYHHVRERLRAEIVEYLHEARRRGAKNEWSKVPVPDEVPARARLNVRVKDVRVVYADEKTELEALIQAAAASGATMGPLGWILGGTVIAAIEANAEGDLELVGSLELEPQVRVSCRAGGDPEGSLPECCEDPTWESCWQPYEGAGPGALSVPASQVWSATEEAPAEVGANESYPWEEFPLVVNPGVQTYEILYPAYGEDGRLDTDSFYTAIEDFRLAARLTLSESDDFMLGADDEFVQYVYDSEGVRRGARATGFLARAAAFFRLAGEIDMKTQVVDDERKATSSDPHIARIVMVNTKNSEGAKMAVTVTLEGWLEEDSRPFALSEEELTLAKYTRAVADARPEPSPLPTERLAQTIPNLVAHYTLDGHGLELTGRSADIPGEFPPERSFDGGLLYAHPWLGREGEFDELPYYEPVFEVPSITDGNFTVRLSFRARSPVATGVEGEALSDLPLIQRGEGEFAITNRAVTMPASAKEQVPLIENGEKVVRNGKVVMVPPTDPKSDTYSEKLAVGVNRDQVLAFETWHRAPVWATVTAAVDRETRQIRYRFETKLPSFMNMIPERSRVSERTIRMGRSWDPGTSTTWYLSGESDDGAALYAADVVDEVMFFDEALTFGEMAALPSRETPGVDDRAREVGDHVRSMYRFASRLPDLDDGGMTDEDWEERYRPALRKLISPTIGWVASDLCNGGRGTFINDSLKDDVLTQIEFERFSDSCQDAIRKAAGVEKKRKSVRSDWVEQADGSVVNVYARDYWAKNGAKLKAALPPRSTYFQFGDTAIPDANGNELVDRDEWMQFPEGGRLFLLSAMRMTPETMLEFERTADLVLNHYLELAVLAADIDGDHRLDAAEAAMVTAALEAELDHLGASGAMPALPKLKNSKINTWHMPVNKSSQGRIAEWLMGILEADLGVQVEKIPIGIKRLDGA